MPFQKDSGIQMPELQDDSQAEQETPKRKLTWDEMHLAMKKVHAKEKRFWWMKRRFMLEKGRKASRKQLEKKRFKRQEEHPEEILAKRKFWIIVKK
jgi:hypothetical protein